MAKETSKTLERVPAVRRELQDPLRSMIGLRDTINGMFEDFFSGRPLLGPTLGAYEEKGWTPLVDIFDAGDELVVYAGIPGMKKQDCNVEVKDGALVISGKIPETAAKEEWEDVRHELPCGEFHRAFSLPDEIKAEGVKASYHDGLLEIRLPKAQGAKTRRVDIQ